MTWVGGCVKDSLSYKNAKFDSLPQLMKQNLPLWTQVWGDVWYVLTFTLFIPFQYLVCLREFKMLAMNKTPTGNPPCPPFVCCAKQIFITFWNIGNISSSSGIQSLRSVNTILEQVGETVTINDIWRFGTTIQGFCWRYQGDLYCWFCVFSTTNLECSPINLNEQARAITRSILSLQKAARDL